MQLLEHALPELGKPSRRAPVRLEDIASFEGAFLSNARGVAIVSAVDALSCRCRQRACKRSPTPTRRCPGIPSPISGAAELVAAREICTAHLVQLCTG